MIETLAMACAVILLARGISALPGKEAHHDNPRDLLRGHLVVAAGLGREVACRKGGATTPSLYRRIALIGPPPASNGGYWTRWD